MEQTEAEIFIALTHICSKQLKEVLVSALLVTASLISICYHQLLCSCKEKGKKGNFLVYPCEAENHGTTSLRL